MVVNAWSVMLLSVARKVAVLAVVYTAQPVCVSVTKSKIQRILTVYRFRVKVSRTRGELVVHGHGFVASVQLG
jgi:hypothetical protein